MGRILSDKVEGVGGCAGDTAIVEMTCFLAPCSSPQENGRATRELILTHADEMVENWPACSADLSPIENVWNIVERRLWSAYTWRDLNSFKTAIAAFGPALIASPRLARLACLIPHYLHGFGLVHLRQTTLLSVHLCSVP